METHRQKIDRICLEAQTDMQMGWLAWTMYQKYAEKVLYKYLKETIQGLID